MQTSLHTNDPFLIRNHLDSLLETNLFSTDLNGFLNRFIVNRLSDNLDIYLAHTSNLTGVMRSKGSIYLEIPLDDFSFSINGQLISTSETPLHIILTRENKLTYFSINESYRSIRLAVDYTHFTYLYQKYLGEVIDFENASTFLKFENSKLKQEFCDLVMPLTKELASTSHRAEDRGQLADEILKAIILGLSKEAVHAERPYCNTLALRAHEIILKTPHQKLSIPEVCRQLSSSSRSLQQGFKQVYGMGFIKYHKLYRLNKLREYIRKNGVKSGELTSLMGMFGFTHSGRFSQEYKREFGVLPSQEEKLDFDRSDNSIFL